MKNENTLFERIKINAQNHKFIVAILIIFLLVTGFALFLTSITDIKNFFIPSKSSENTKDPLISNAKQLSQEIIDFTNERKINEPYFNMSNWDNSVRESERYSTETMNIYYSKYSSRVGFMIDKFKERGITNENVERMYQFPTNYFGLRDIGIGLGEMANKLEWNTK